LRNFFYLIKPGFLKFMGSLALASELWRGGKILPLVSRVTLERHTGGGLELCWQRY
jgi:hypothetical protein